MEFKVKEYSNPNFKTNHKQETTYQKKNTSLRKERREGYKQPIKQNQILPSNPATIKNSNYQNVKAKIDTNIKLSHRYSKQSQNQKIKPKPKKNLKIENKKQNQKIKPKTISKIDNLIYNLKTKKNLSLSQSFVEVTFEISLKQEIEKKLSFLSLFKTNKKIEVITQKFEFKTNQINLERKYRENDHHYIQFVTSYYNRKIDELDYSFDTIKHRDNSNSEWWINYEKKLDKSEQIKIPNTPDNNQDLGSYHDSYQESLSLKIIMIEYFDYIEVKGRENLFNDPILDFTYNPDNLYYFRQYCINDFIEEVNKKNKGILWKNKWKIGSYLRKLKKIQEIRIKRLPLILLRRWKIVSKFKNPKNMIKKENLQKNIHYMNEVESLRKNNAKCYDSNDEKYGRFLQEQIINECLVRSNKIIKINQNELKCFKMVITSRIDIKELREDLVRLDKILESPIDLRAPKTAGLINWIDRESRNAKILEIESLIESQRTNVLVEYYKEKIEEENKEEDEVSENDSEVENNKVENIEDQNENNKDQSENDVPKKVSFDLAILNYKKLQEETYDYLYFNNSSIKFQGEYSKTYILYLKNLASSSHQVIHSNQENIVIACSKMSEMTPEELKECSELELQSNMMFVSNKYMVEKMRFQKKLKLRTKFEQWAKKIIIYDQKSKQTDEADNFNALLIQNEINQSGLNHDFEDQKQIVENILKNRLTLVKGASKDFKTSFIYSTLKIMVQQMRKKLTLSKQCKVLFLCDEYSKVKILASKLQKSGIQVCIFENRPEQTSKKSKNSSKQQKVNKDLKKMTFNKKIQEQKPKRIEDRTQLLMNCDVILCELINVKEMIETIQSLFEDNIFQFLYVMIFSSIQYSEFYPSSIISNYLQKLVYLGKDENSIYEMGEGENQGEEDLDQEENNKVQELKKKSKKNYEKVMKVNESSVLIIQPERESLIDLDTVDENDRKRMIKDQRNIKISHKISKQIFKEKEFKAQYIGYGNESQPGSQEYSSINSKNASIVYTLYNQFHKTGICVSELGVLCFNDVSRMAINDKLSKNFKKQKKLNIELHDSENRISFENKYLIVDCFQGQYLNCNILWEEIHRLLMQDLQGIILIGDEYDLRQNTHLKQLLKNIKEQGSYMKISES